MISNRCKVKTIFEHLRADGVADTRLAHVRAPIGLDLKRRSQAEIALAIWLKSCRHTTARPANPGCWLYGQVNMSDDNLLLHSFAITHVMDCIADPTKNRVIAEFSDDISSVFPYLNTIVPNLMYNPGAKSATVKRGGRILTFYPHVAVMAKVDGVEDAEEQLRWFQKLCNDTWRHRDEIVPCYERRQPLGFLDVYQLLPKLNCGACGEATCIAFAFRLLFGELSLETCPHLAIPPYDEGGRRLAQLIV